MQTMIEAITANKELCDRITTAKQQIRELEAEKVNLRTKVGELFAPKLVGKQFILESCQHYNYSDDLFREKLKQNTLLLDALNTYSFEQAFNGRMGLVQKIDTIDLSHNQIIWRFTIKPQKKDGTYGLKTFRLDVLDSLFTTE